MRTLLLFLVLSSAAQAEDGHAAFYGTWGTSDQCTRALIKPEGTVTFEPFEIGQQWLRHGQLWCQLDWGPLAHRTDGLFTVANAKCGEDAASGYLLGMKLTDGILTLQWDPFWANGPLQQCPIS